MKRSIMVNGIFIVALLLVGASISPVQAEDGKTQAAEHRSAVSKVIQGLKDPGMKDKGVSDEVKAVIDEQEKDQEKTTKAIESVENRNSLKTFLVGSDYKNLGEIRSSLVTTDNHIDRLTKAKERATDEVVKKELEAQIAALTAEKVKVEVFVKTNESKFSLFGWLNRWLQK